jgi:dihydroneopterin aldolase
MKETSLTRLTIKDAVFYAYHGVKSEEQVLGGKYEVDLDLYYNATEAIINDDVNYAVNYEEAMVCIEDVITEESYNLIETITNEILNQVMERMPNIEKATVRVRKINVPIRNVVSYIEAEQSITRK